MTNSLWSFTFRNKVSLELTPIVLSFAPSLESAEDKVRKYFPKYLYDKVKCMQVSNKHFVGILSYDNINLQNFLYDAN